MQLRNWVVIFLIIAAALWSNVAHSKTRIEVEDPRLAPVIQSWTNRYREVLRQSFPFLQSRDVYLYGVRDREALHHKASGLNLSSPPPWAFGVCWPQRNVIILRLDGSLDTIKQTLIHELVHLEFGVSFQRSQTPVWFSEGMAQYMERTLSSSASDFTLYAQRWGKAQPIANLIASFPSHGAVASRAYAQSEAMLNFMVREFGVTTFQLFVKGLHESELHFEQRFIQSFKMDLSRFESLFLSRVHTARWWHELFKDTTIFSILGLVLAIGGWRARRNQKLRLAKMRALEADPPK